MIDALIDVLGEPKFSYWRQSDQKRTNSYWWLDVPAQLAFKAKSIDPVNVRLIDIPGQLTFEVNYFNASA